MSLSFSFFPSLSLFLSLYIYVYIYIYIYHPGEYVDIIVSLSVQIASQETPTELSSIPVGLLSYAHPIITNISHSSCTNSSIFTSSNSSKVSVGLLDCPRNGGGTLWVEGSNLGEAGAVIIIGSGVCTDLIHESSDRVKCELPAGTTLDTAMVFIQAGGIMNLEDASVSWTQCQPGTFQEGSNLECIPCPIGSVSTVQGQVSCSPCSAGSYADMNGTACRACLPGTYSSAGAQCLQCLPGTYSASYGSLMCLDCNMGYTQPQAGMSGCEICHAGTYMDKAGSSASDCDICMAGTMSRSGAQSCVFCQSSIDFQPNPGQATCIRCVDWSVASINHTSCDCQRGYYAIPFGDFSLFNKLDPQGYTRYWDDFVMAVPLPENDPNEIVGFWCVPCPTGADCNRVGTTIEEVTSAEGFFMGFDGTGTVFLPCLNGACLSEGDCDSPYTGPLCTECDGADLVLSEGFECRQCAPVYQILLFCLVGLIMFGLFVWYKFRNNKQQQTARGAFIKIVISSFQLNGLALSYAFNWDNLMADFLYIQSQSTSLGTAYLEWQCLYTERGSSDGFVLDSIVYLFTPPGMMMLVFWVALLYRLVKLKAELPAAWGKCCGIYMSYLCNLLHQYNSSWYR